jgi:2'-5' RNA ligase
LRRSPPGDRTDRPEEAFRGFVAVLLPEAVREAVARVAAPLRGHGKVKWVAPENYHLTLKFLGQVPVARAEGLCASLREAAAESAPFRLELAGVGAFPSVGRPQTVWVGVTAGHEALAALTAVTEQACAAHGFPREKRAFHAHLTLGSVQSPAGRETLAARLRESEAESIGAIEIAAIHLMKSQLLPRGPVYSVEESFPLFGEKP